MKNKCYLPKSFEELKSLPDKKLRFYWDIFYNVSLSERANKYRPLWYSVQCELYRSRLAHKYITRLNRYASNPERYIHCANKRKYSLSVGTIINKLYKGKIYQITVKGENLYEWDGNIYKNLSAIACEITKGHVSGPKFFGLLNK